ncbi:MAG: DUF1573 domain-containing protein [Chitinophagaceae bacterium]|nr:DUF1573 domain-containing protein [Chitinophagaceae bacterium]
MKIYNHEKIIIVCNGHCFFGFAVCPKTVADIAKFDTETINQGNLKLNEAKEVRFIVTNISKEPLLIEEAKPGCGCTLGDYTKRRSHRVQPVSSLQNSMQLL